MATKFMHVFDRLMFSVTCWKKSRTQTGRRKFHRDVEKEEFQYASTQCLSSYYSVFVVRLAIMVMLAILIGLLTILTWHFTKIYTTKSLNSLAYDLRYELLQRPILRMWNILNSTAEITTAQVKLSEYVIRSHNKLATQEDHVEMYEAMRAVTWALFSSRKALNSITVKYGNGFVQAFHRDLKDNNTFYIYTDLAYNETNEALNEKDIHNNKTAIWYREQLDPVSGEKIGKAMKIAPEDSISIAGMSQVPDGVASWHVSVSKFTDSPLLSAALPVWDSSNKSIVAVVGVTTALYSVEQLMKELVDKHSGHMYLTSQKGYLLATSTNDPLLTNSTKKPKLKMAVDCDNEVIREGATWLQKTYGNNFPPSHEVHVENARLGHQQYYIDSFFLNLKKLPLVGVIILPRKHIMGQADQRAFKTLVILISASLCIIVIGCVCILILTNGVSKEMNLRAELISHLEARRKAEASSNYKSQFLANMSHELRTPMAAVIGLLDILLSDDCLTNEQYATVTQIRKCSTTLLRLLNNILDLSKVESGKLVLEDAEFDLGKELEGLVDMFSVQCIDHNVEIILDISDDMPNIVRGDSDRVVQIFANLINNSIKFTLSSITSGKPLPEEVLSNTTEAYDRALVLDSAKKKVLDFVDSRMGYIAPNVSAIVGNAVAAKLMRTTGGLSALSKMHACNVQLLVGYIKQTEIFQTTPPSFRTRACQLLAEKSILAAQVDSILLIMCEADFLTGTGHIILRGWCENPDSYGNNQSFTMEQKKLVCSQKTKTKQHENHAKKTSINDNKMILWFEVDDTGCGIDPSKWDSVFESFEQADLSTTRLHGGTGLGLCIVRSLVNKMGGEIKIVKKEGPGTLMRLYLQLTAPVDATEQHCQVDFANNNLVVLLALHGNMSRLITSKWLQKNGVVTMEASEWNGLTQVLKELFHAKTPSHNNDFDAHYSAHRGLKTKLLSMQELTNPTFVIAIDIDLLDLSTDIWKEQLNFLHKYYARAKFVWLQNHDSSNNVKAELRKKGHILIVNKPLYKAKMIHILEDVIKERNIEVQKKNMITPRTTVKESDLHESFEIDYNHCDVASSDGSDISEIGSSNPSSLYLKSNCLLGLTNEYLEQNSSRKEASISKREKGEDSECGRIIGSTKAVNGKKSLEGLRILLAEDTVVIQRVATIMLEKMGAIVVAVGDGQQAVDALNGTLGVEDCRKESLLKERNKETSQNEIEILSFPAYDLILMDCQMPKMDGYEATKEIRKSEVGTGFHIPIVALTAHAMSCDEAKCLEVGMDAYLTKPIDFKLMESTILSLTREKP